jgi:hypothetical protein
MPKRNDKPLLPQYPLEKAIQMEIDSKGEVRAEDLCKKHAKLIAYLRGVTK